MNKLSLVIPYYKSNNIISRKFEEWQEYDQDVKDNLEVIIVDDGSPEGTRFEEQWVDTELNIKLYRIEVDIPWNECGANNLGIKMASNDFILRTDVDWFIPNNLLKKIMNMDLNKNMLYLFHSIDFYSRQKLIDPANIYVINKETFWTVGGYDEDTRGHYGSDLSFRYRTFTVYKTKVVFIEDYPVEAYVNVSNQHGLVRDAGFCYAQLEEKKQNNILTPTSYIRFDWKQIK